jgi:hypothetical protein
MLGDVIPAALPSADADNAGQAGADHDAVRLLSYPRD